MSRIEYVLTVVMSALVGMVVYVASGKLILLAFVAAAVTALVVLKFLEKINVP